MTKVNIDETKKDKEKGKNRIFFHLVSVMGIRFEDYPQKLLILLNFLSPQDFYKSLHHLNARFDELLRFVARLNCNWTIIRIKPPMIRCLLSS